VKLRSLVAAGWLAGFSLAAVSQTNPENHLKGIDWENYQRQAVELFQQYLRVDTSNPPGNELAAAEFFPTLRGAPTFTLSSKVTARSVP
jgi:hypothetical protein